MAISVNDVHCWDKGEPSGGMRFVVVLPSGVGFYSDGEKETYEEGEFEYNPLKVGLESEYGKAISYLFLPPFLQDVLAKMVMRVNRNEWDESCSPSERLFRS
ncbi:MAG: hypothetical protein WC477_07745 [Patescibacteria group bacterium]